MKPQKKFERIEFPIDKGRRTRQWEGGQSGTGTRTEVRKYGSFVERDQWKISTGKG